MALETWLKEDQNWELNIQGYASIRETNRWADGVVALLVRNAIQSLAKHDRGSEDVESL